MRPGTESTPSPEPRVAANANVAGHRKRLLKKAKTRLERWEKWGKDKNIQEQDFEWATSRISQRITFSAQLHFPDISPKGVFLETLERSLGTYALANLQPAGIAEIIEVFDDLSNSWRSRLYNRKHQKSQLRLTLTKEDRVLLTELSEKKGLTKQKEAILAALAEFKALKTSSQELSERVAKLQERQQELEKDLIKEREKSAELESEKNSLRQKPEALKENQKDLESDPIHKELYELMNMGDSDH